MPYFKPVFPILTALALALLPLSTGNAQTSEQIFTGKDLKAALERQDAHAHRLLEDIDRVHLAARQLEAGFDREQQQRRQSEEAVAQTLEAGRRRPE